MLTTAGSTIAATAPHPVVMVQYVVSERLPERVEETVTSPLERALMTLDRVADIHTRTGHGTVDAEVHFDGGATEQDLAAVMKRVAQLEFGDGVRAASVSFHLRRPRLQ